MAALPDFQSWNKTEFLFTVKSKKKVASLFCLAYKQMHVLTESGVRIFFEYIKSDNGGI